MFKIAASVHKWFSEQVGLLLAFNRLKSCDDMARRHMTAQLDKDKAKIAPFLRSSALASHHLPKR